MASKTCFNSQRVGKTCHQNVPTKNQRADFETSSFESMPANSRFGVQTGGLLYVLIWGSFHYHRKRHYTPPEREESRCGAP